MGMLKCIMYAPSSNRGKDMCTAGKRELAGISDQISGQNVLSFAQLFLSA